MITETERRYIGARELRAVENAAGPRLLGYAALFDVLSEDLGGFREVIKPGAFAQTLAADVRALFNHDPNYVLGRTTNDTLRLSEDARGLAIDVTLPPTSYARDLWTLIQRGDITQMSFGFRVPKGGDSWTRSAGAVIRTLTRLDLVDVSPVTYPAYTATSVTARTLADLRQALEGLSRTDGAGLEAAERRRLIALLEES